MLSSVSGPSTCEEGASRVGVGCWILGLQFAGELYIFVLELDGTNVVHPLKRYGITRQFDNDFS